MSDPSKRQVKCPGCGHLMHLDHGGRFVAHTPGPRARDWCPESGRAFRGIGEAREAKEVRG